GVASAIAFSPDGKQAVSGHQGYLRLWDVDTGREVWRWRENKSRYAILSVAFSPDGKSVLSGDDHGGRRLWSIAGKGAPAAPVRPFAGHAGAARGVAFSPDGRRCLTGGADGSVRLWDVATGTQTLKLTGHAGEVRGVAFSADGRRAVSAGGDKSVRLWALED